MTVAEAPAKTGRAPKPLPLSVKAYHTLGEMGLIPEKTELLYGQVYQKMPKSPYHSYLQQFLIEALTGVLPRHSYLRVEQPITCADSEPEPDLSVVSGRKEDYRLKHPHTAEFGIEVCVTSHEYDHLKLRAYANAGVKEVWLVLATEKQIESFRKPEAENFAQRSIHGPGGRLASAVIPGFALDLDALFAK
jgi:Uma2 family endonuclease